MARADSSIRVRIIGDASSLQGAARQSELAVTGIGGAAKKVGGAIVAGFAVDAIFDFGNSALSEADRVGDAAGRLEEQLGDLSQPILDAADDMAHLGQSRGDILELGARIADMGTAAGVADDKLGPMSISAAETAAALALITDTDADTWIENIGKAAGGSDRPLKDLGINLSDAEVEARALADTGKDTAGSLTEGELSAARFALILEKLAPRVKTVTDGTADLEQRQGELQARWETLTGRIGEALEGPLNDFLGWVLAGIDGLGLLDDLFQALEQNVRDALGPLARAADLLGDIVALAEKATGINITSGVSDIPGGFGNFGGGSVTLNVQGGSPEVVEQAVRDAVNTIVRHGPLDDL